MIKRGVISGLILLVLLTITLTLVNAQIPPETPEQLNKTLQNITGAFNKTVHNPVNMPPAVAGVMKVIFGIEQNTPLNFFVIQIVLWLFFVFFLSSIFVVFSFFSETTSFFISVGLAIISSTMGIFSNFSQWLSGTVNSTTAWVSVGVILLIIIFIRQIFKKLGLSKKIDEVEEESFKAGFKISRLGKLYDKFNKEDKS